MKWIIYGKNKKAPSLLTEKWSFSEIRLSSVRVIEHPARRRGKACQNLFGVYPYHFEMSRNIGTDLLP